MIAAALGALFLMFGVNIVDTLEPTCELPMHPAIFSAKSCSPLNLCIIDLFDPSLDIEGNGTNPITHALAMARTV